MKIGPELKTFYINSPYSTFTLFIPEVAIARDEYYGDYDASFSANTSFCASSYEYGYLLRIIVLGFGFELWVGKNI